MDKKKGCYLYIRVSTDIQVEGYSLEAQKEVLEKEAKHRGYVIKGIYADEGKSGKNTQDRVEFLKMMEHIVSHDDEVDFVLVFKLSRFARNAADALKYLQIMQDNNVNLLCVKDSLDSSSSMGKLMITILSSVAELELENIRTQTMAGRIQKASQGLWNGGFAPYGYILLEGKLIINENEADIVRLIYDKYDRYNMGVNAIAKFLNENGYIKYPRKKANKENTDSAASVNASTRFSASFVKGVLDNPIYAGYISYGRRKNEKIIGKTNEYHVVKQKEYPLYDGIHEAIIDKEQWHRVQEKRKITGVKREKTHSLEHAHILSSIVKCPICGAPMYGVVNRKKKKGTSDYYTDMWYYICKNRKTVNNQRCDYSKHIRQDLVNSQVEAIVKEALKGADFYKVLSDSTGIEGNIKEITKTLERLRSQHSKEVHKKDKIKERMMQLDPDDVAFDDLYDELQDMMRGIAIKIKELSDTIAQKEIALENATENKMNLKSAKQEYLKMLQEYDNSTDEEKKKLMQVLLDSVYIFPEIQENGLIVDHIRFKFKMKVELDDKVKLFDTVYYDDIDEISVENSDDVREDNSPPKMNHDETVCLLSRKAPV